MRTSKIGADTQLMWWLAVCATGPTQPDPTRPKAWFVFDWNATVPVWERVVATELYSHKGDKGDSDSGETLEFDNLASVPEHAGLVHQLHQNLTDVVKLGLVPPMLDLERDPLNGTPPWSTL